MLISLIIWRYSQIVDMVNRNRITGINAPNDTDPLNAVLAYINSINNRIVPFLIGPIKEDASFAIK